MDIAKPIRTRQMPIRRRLIYITLATITLAELFAGSVLAYYDTRAFRIRKSEEVMAEARILASSITASVAFGDVKSTRDYLSSLAANPQIDAAAVFSTDGTLFTNYLRAGAKVTGPRRAVDPGIRFSMDHVFVTVPVMEGKTFLGSVWMSSMVAPLWERLVHYLGIMLLAALGSFAIAMPLSFRLNEAITVPLNAVAAAARRITTGDFDVEIPSSGEGDDEIGVLTTAFGQMVASIRSATEELERQVERRTAELATSNKELEAFSYSVSHDLRAPLRAIDGFSRILEEDYGQGLDGEGKRLLGVIRTNAQRMANLIDDLLAFSRLGRQAITPVPTDMAVLAKEAWREVETAQPERAIAFHLAEPLPQCACDRALFKQVWVNLLSNAAKYSSAREQAVVEVYAEESASAVTFHVRDNGAGFDMRYYDKLFGVFQRLHSATEFPGTGVGLAIVQRVVIRHGGRIWAEGKVGEGAIFSFSLPAAGNA